jgi:hypothetical protein
MEKVFFADSWKFYFEEFCLRKFRDFYNYPLMPVLSGKRRRHVDEIIFEGENGLESFYLKRFYTPRIEDIAASILSRGRIVSEARIEWENARYLLNNGFGAYEPVCYGESSRGLFEFKSFIVTRQLDSTCLLQFVIERWDGLCRDMQNKIIVAAAKEIRRMYDMDIFFPDLLIWHFFIQPDSLEGEIDFSIIDLHRMRQRVHSRGNRIKELGKFYWSMSEDYFDNDHKDLFITTYLQTNDVSKKKKLMEKIRKYHSKLNKRRNLRDHYMSSRFNVDDDVDYRIEKWQWF